MNKKGFTLVELLVSITIMGIISGLAYPSISKLVASNNQKKYEYYAESLKQGAKLYIDSYEDDIWDEGQNGCYDIKYSELITHNLVKKYSDTEIVCGNSDGTMSNGINTYVRVTRTNGKFTYDINIICKRGEKVAYQKSLTTPTCSGTLIK